MKSRSCSLSDNSHRIEIEEEETENEIIEKNEIMTNNKLEIRLTIILFLSLAFAIKIVSMFQLTKIKCYEFHIEIG